MILTFEKNKYKEKMLLYIALILAFSLLSVLMRKSNDVFILAVPAIFIILFISKKYVYKITLATNVVQLYYYVFFIKQIKTYPIAPLKAKYALLHQFRGGKQMTLTIWNKSREVFDSRNSDFNEEELQKIFDHFTAVQQPKVSGASTENIITCFYVDFSEIIGNNLVMLSKSDTKNDRAGNSFILYEGMPITVYCDDVSSEEDVMYADGFVTLNKTKHGKHVKWCCKYIEKGIYTR